MKILLMGICLLVSSPAMAEQWWIAPHHQDAESVYVVFGDAQAGKISYDTFDKAMDHIPIEKRLAGVNINGWLDWDSDKLQFDIHSYFEKHHSQKLMVARRSSGKHDNPRVLFLAKSFPKALQSTKRIKLMGQMLLRYGYRMTGTTYEKFSIDNSETLPRFRSGSNWVLVY
jgi:hypothetical protein